MNAYALMNSMGMYEGQRSVAPDQRVFILTRSGFAGIQRYGTATWSGDTTSTWTAMKKQIAAGLGFSISGTPYWTMDIGGYTMENKFSARNPTPANADEWRELNARWFEFGVFCPITRLHGELQPREPWAFGGTNSPAFQAIVKFDNLRYRLLPYIYSLAGETTHHAGTIMRPFVMDFPDDAVAREITDEYMFGPAFLVAPVTTYQARNRDVYLPATAGGWYDFWTGSAIPRGRIFSWSVLRTNSVAGWESPARPRLTTPCRSSSRPVPSFPPGRTSNTPVRNPPTPSRSGFTPERTARSRFTKTMV